MLFLMCIGHVFNLVSNLAPIIVWLRIGRWIGSSLNNYNIIISKLFKNYFFEFQNLKFMNKIDITFQLYYAF